MLPFLGATLPPYPQIVDISGKKEIQKEKSIKTGNFYSVGLYQREVVLRGVRGKVAHAE